MIRIIGSFVSPYVRKTLACLNLKGLAYEVDPITPFFGGPEFDRLSPLRRIPVMIDGDVTISDSSVICAYLDEAYPERPLLPEGAKARARARWLEEYADTRLGDVFIWNLFYQRFAHPLIWKAPGDEARVQKNLAEDMPRELSYLEHELPAEGFLFGHDIGLADIAIAAFFQNGIYADFRPDFARWPKVAAFVVRAYAQPCLADLLPYETAQVSTGPEGRRAALAAVGAPVSEATVGVGVAQKGVMRL